MGRLLFVRFPIALLIALLAAAIFPRRGGEERLVSPRWTLALDQSSPSAGDGAAIGFAFADRFGYVTPQGELRHLQPIDYGATFTDERFSLFPPVTRFQAFLDNSGQLIGGFEQAGYPLLSGERILVSGPEGDMLSEWTLGGRKLWERSWGMVIGSVAVGRTSLIVGLLDGRVAILDSGGTQLGELVDDESRLPVTLATAVAAGDHYGAAISGIDPQRLLLFRLAAEGVETVRDVALGSDFRRPVLLQFIADDRWLAYETEDGLDLLALQGSQQFSLPAVGELRVLEEFSGGYGLLSSASDGEYQLQLVIAPDHTIAAFTIQATDMLLRAHAGLVLIGIDGVLMALTIE